MATSPNFSWPEPDNTDLVKNGALAIRTAINAIDTSMAELKGGTTGQESAHRFQCVTTSANHQKKQNRCAAQ